MVLFSKIVQTLQFGEEDGIKERTLMTRETTGIIGDSVCVQKLDILWITAAALERLNTFQSHVAG